jgi:hypothetical protein
LFSPIFFREEKAIYRRRGEVLKQRFDKVERRSTEESDLIRLLLELEFQEKIDLSSSNLDSRVD